MALCVLVSLNSIAQNRAITTAAPFMRIVPDARAGSMGDMGVATSADAWSLFHNPSKIAFSDRQVKTGITYSPWLRNLTDDIFVGSAAYINRFSENAAWHYNLNYNSIDLGSSDYLKTWGIQVRLLKDD